MVKERKNFTYGDRTNFSLYNSIKSYRAANPLGRNTARVFLEDAIRQNGFAVYIESVESKDGKDLSDLASHIEKPDYVFGPSFKLKDSAWQREVDQVVARFIKQGEAAHRATKNSKSVFKKDMAKQLKVNGVSLKTQRTDLLGHSLTRKDISKIFQFESDERERAYRAVRRGKVSGHIGHDSITIYMGPSSVTYRNGCTTYGL